MNKSFPDLDALREQLKALSRQDFLQLADEAKVPRSTAQKIRFGHSGNPSYANVVALAVALDRRSASAKRKPRVAEVVAPAPAAAGA